MPPLRSLEDFILGSSRFQIPKSDKPKKWLKRVLRNLIYYQSNYCLAALLLFALATFIQPLTMFQGMAATALDVGAVSLIPNYFTSPADKKMAAIISFLVITSIWFSKIAVVFIELFLTIAAILVHAYLRKRNLDNKIANNMEKFGLRKKTLVGMLFDVLKIPAELF